MEVADVQARGFRRYVALGDSLTEGMCDPAPEGFEHAWRGWADRLADALGARAAERGEAFDYANLAIRGKLLTEIIAEQVPVALDLRPDLVRLVGGGTEVGGAGGDRAVRAGTLADAGGGRRASGATVLMGTAYDPREAPLIKRARGLAGVFTANVWTIARRHGAQVIDLWGMQALQDRRMWAPDRIHLTADGHRRVAAQALDVLGIGGEAGWHVPLPAAAPRC